MSRKIRNNGLGSADKLPRINKSRVKKKEFATLQKISMEIKKIDREEEVVFSNWTDEDYVGRWDFAKKRREWVLEKGKKVLCPFYLAEHFAIGLVQREINKLANKEREEIPKKTEHRRYLKLGEIIDQKYLTNNKLRQEMMDKCVKGLSDDGIEEEPIVRVKLREVPEEEIMLLNRDIRGAIIEEETGYTDDGYDRNLVRKSRAKK